MNPTDPRTTMMLPGRSQRPSANDMRIPGGQRSCSPAMSATQCLSFHFQFVIHFHQPRLDKLPRMMACVFPSGTLDAISGNEFLLAARSWHRECSMGQGEKVLTM